MATVGHVASVVSILNEATLKLLSRGIQQWDYPWDAAYIHEQIEQGNCFIVRTGNDVIGTFFMNYIDALNGLSIENQSVYLSKIAVHPRNQGRNIGAGILSFAQSYSRRVDKPLYLDCWDGNVKLKHFYSRNGFKDMGKFPEKDYWIRIFRF